MKIRSLVAVLAIAAVALTAVPLLASAGPGDGAHPHKRFTKEQRAKFRAKMKARFGELLRDKMQLTEDKAQRVEKLMTAFRQKKRPLRKEMKQSHRALRVLLKEDSNDQRAYAQALNTIVKTRAKLKKLHKAQVSAIKQLLNPKQQAQLMVAHHKFRRHMGRHWGHGKRGGKGWHGRRGRHQRGGDAAGDYPPPAGAQGDVR
ncbi:MAG: periplasmic heavy metal sensor [Myxococcales bacterium]|nr:periplasmic heavy metal sensor [Myxococcales bacterium]